MSAKTSLEGGAKMNGPMPTASTAAAAAAIPMPISMNAATNVAAAIVPSRTGSAVAGGIRPPTSQLFSRGNLTTSRLGSRGGAGGGGDKTAMARPSTAVRAVGYAANKSGSAGQRFDQFFLEKAKQQTLSSANAAVDAAKEINPQIKYRMLEAKITKLLEESIMLAAQCKATNTNTSSNINTNKNVSSSNNNAPMEMGTTTTATTATTATTTTTTMVNASTNEKTKANLAEALNKAKEAFSLDRSLHRHRDLNGENSFHNFELTYAVLFNFADQLEQNDMHIEALNTYSMMTKNKMFPHVNQLKLNMGNIYSKMTIYPKAIKMYRMALDSVPNSLKQLRLKITQNIGILFVRLGQYADAASSFEFIMSERGDITNGIHLLLCYYAIGDVEKIKSSFRSLCDVQPLDADNELETENNIIKLQQHATAVENAHDDDIGDGDGGGGGGDIIDDTNATLLDKDGRGEGNNWSAGGPMKSAAIIDNNSGHTMRMANDGFTIVDGVGGGGGGIGGGIGGGVATNDGSSNGNSSGTLTGGNRNTNKLNASQREAERQRYVIRALKNDELAIYMKQRRNNEKRAITMIVDLISPLIEENYNDGYNWCIEVIKNSNLVWLVNELELNKALVYLRQNDINQAIETLQMYDRKSEGSMTASALTNLSFIYINLGKLDMALHCVNQMNEIGALQSNAMALVNASIIDYQKQNYSAARVKLERALQIQPDHFEANYNLGLVAMKANDLDLAEEQFELLKRQLLVPHSVQHSHVYYQLARLQEQRHLPKAGGPNFKLTSTPGALQSFLQVLGISAAETDSRLYEKVGGIYEQMQDHQEAIQYYNEAYRINPSDIAIASSIGSYYIKLQATEKAIYYYERAVLANPTDPNLMLRIASCFRHSYMPPKQYLGMFERIYSRFPDNIMCVRALVQVSKSLGMMDLHEKYSQEHTRLQKAEVERQNEQRYQQQRLSSGASGGRGSSRMRSYRTAQEDPAVNNRIMENENRGSITSSITSNFNGEQYIRTTEATFSDPLGPAPERPRTGMVQQRPSQDTDDDDDDDDEINANSLLPI